MKRPDLRKGLRRGVYVIPTSFTILNLFFGFRCIYYVTRALEAISTGHQALVVDYFETASLSLLFAAIFDTFDGMVARQLGATSEFGKEYDSLADCVTFGCAPAILVYAWGLHPLDRLGGGLAFLFLAATSLRLARFNVQTGKTDYRFFVGLPCPAGAMVIASLINYTPSPVTDQRFAVVIAIVTVAVAFAMVSPIRYRSQKGVNFQRERSLMYFVMLALIVAIASRWPHEFWLVGSLLYLASGPIARIGSFVFRSRRVDPVEVPPQPLETH